jgi:phosphoserine aminotransferase
MSGKVTSPQAVSRESHRTRNLKQTNKRSRAQCWEGLSEPTRYEVLVGPSSDSFFGKWTGSDVCCAIT